MTKAIRLDDLAGAHPVGPVKTYVYYVVCDFQTKKEKGRVRAEVYKRGFPIASVDDLRRIEDQFESVPRGAQKIITFYSLLREDVG
jgi:hypothetical protein